MFQLISNKMFALISTQNLLPPIEFRLIKVHSKSPQKDDSITIKSESNCLKVPKLYESSSGSSAGLLTTSSHFSH